LRSAGFQVLMGRESYEAVGYLAGTDQERLDELHRMMSDDRVDAIFCVRGGYGVLRILDQIDFSALAAAPKVLVGYSDITALQLSLFKQTGLASISGPMVAVEWPNPLSLSCRHFMDLTNGRFQPGPLDRDQTQTTLIPGRAEGVLLGGNLSLISRLIGTRHLPDMQGAILFLEEIGETPYRVDGLLAQLQLCGLLDEIAGVVLGGFTEADVAENTSSLTMEQVFEDYFGDLGIPVAKDLRYGHFPEKVAVPIGVRAKLEADSNGSAVLSILESPVR
jgi:muramoyltetrapeptide carboxypeptidase